jgi:hypothetical protein
MTSAARGRVFGGVLACTLLLYVWWYVEAEDFSDARVAGEYVLIHDGVTQRLTLLRDHTFTQEDTRNGITQRATGTWRVFSSTGHMSFSRDFIDSQPAWRGQDSPEVYGLFKNYFGLVSLTFASDTSSVKAYKRMFS